MAHTHRAKSENSSQQQYPVHPSTSAQEEEEEGGSLNCLRHYHDVQLPDVGSKVTPFKDLTHPSKLNKR